MVMGVILVVVLRGTRYYDGGDGRWVLIQMMIMLGVANSLD